MCTIMIAGIGSKWMDGINVCRFHDKATTTNMFSFLIILSSLVVQNLLALTQELEESFL